MNKYKYIVSCGCSWVEGYGTSNKENRLSSLISKHYDAIDINLAEGGGSNEMIFRKIFDWIQDNTDKLKDTLFLIGWTESTRFEYWDNIREEYGKIDVSSFTNANREKDNKDEINHWNFYWKNYFGEKECLKKTNQYIFSLNNIFQNNNCNYLFFNSIGKLTELTKKYYPNQLHMYDDFIESSWEKFCGGNYQDIKDGEGLSYYAKNDGHPSDKGNRIWFEELIKYIK